MDVSFVNMKIKYICDLYVNKLFILKKILKIYFLLYENSILVRFMFLKHILHLISKSNLFWGGVVFRDWPIRSLVFYICLIKDSANWQ